MSEIVQIRNSYIGHSIHALNFPGRLIILTSFSHPSSSLQVFLIKAVSLTLMSKYIIRLFTGFSEMVVFLR